MQHASTFTSRSTNKKSLTNIYLLITEKRKKKKTTEHKIYVGFFFFVCHVEYKIHVYYFIDNKNK